MNKIILAILVLIISFLASNISASVQGWWIPMMMGLVLILGLYLEKTRILDVGTLLLVSSFFFLIQDIPFNYLNFIFILFMIFFFFELWVFMKRELFVKGIEKDLVGNEGIIYLEEYKEHSARYYVKSLFMGLFVSAAGGSIAVHSFIGPFPSGFSLFLNVLFSSMVLFGLYSVMFLVPKYFILE